jgi:hypothetical protein
MSEFIKNEVFFSHIGWSREFQQHPNQKGIVGASKEPVKEWKW